MNDWERTVPVLISSLCKQGFKRETLNEIMNVEGSSLKLCLDKGDEPLHTNNLGIMFALPPNKWANFTVDYESNQPFRQCMHYV
jgi:hypothetical protein